MDFDSEGNLWISIFSGENSFGLAMYNGTELIEYDFSEMTSYLYDQCTSIEIDASDNKWIGQLNGLIKFKEGAIEQINDGIFSLRDPIDLAIESNNRIWLANQNGLTEYNDDDWFCYTYYNSDYPAEYSSSVAIDKNYNKWIGVDDQLIRYDDESWFVYDTSNSPIFYSSHNINNIVIDKNGTKWFTKNGLYKYDNESWNVYTTDNSEIPSNNIECLAVDLSGIVWLGHTGLGVGSFDGEEWNLFDTTTVGPQLYIPFSIYVDSINTKWICTYDGLLSFDGYSWAVYDTNNTDLPSNVIRDCLFDNSGNMWVGTAKGVGVFNGTSWMIYNSTNSSLKQNYIRSLDKSDNNTIWITVGQGGLSVYNENGFLTVAEPNQKPESGVKLSGYPNPFILETNICFKAPESLNGNLVIYNLMGQKIKTLHQGFISSGENDFIWDGTNDNGSDVENGIYFCQLYATKPIGTCKLLLLGN